MKAPQPIRKSWRYSLAVTVVTGLLLLLSAIVPVYAWFASQHDLAAYAPVSSPEALYIGAGHTELENDLFEDIRYMYFNGMDVTDETHYVDRVFCVYGKSISGYRLQLAYTTNNQFTYEIYHATESQVQSASAVAYSTHGATPTTYYYSINGSAIAGTYLNKTTVEGEDLASQTYHTDTYGSYSNVNKYAEPIYWQTTGVEAGSPHGRGNFVNYYILRVRTDAKSLNDRETDVICISAKTFSVLQP